jgi:E3 ubiquitin-protein ligase RGLG
MGNSSSSSSTSSRKQLHKSKSHLNADGSWNPIPDNYHSLEDVEKGLRRAGLESSNLIFGIDLTKSNEWQGKRTFNGLNLHTLSPYNQNPYEKCLDVISRTLAPFDDDDIIPCFGFGCSRTNDKSVLDIGECHGLLQMLARYRALIPHVKLAGPTSFGPIIRRAVDIVVNDGNSYHILGE